jgi:hypothetical protein
MWWYILQILVFGSVMAASIHWDWMDGQFSYAPVFIAVCASALATALLSDIIGMCRRRAARLRGETRGEDLSLPRIGRRSRNALKDRGSVSRSAG